MQWNVQTRLLKLFLLRIIVFIDFKHFIVVNMITVAHVVVHCAVAFAS